MRSSNNPVLKSLSEVRTTNYYGGYQQQAHDPYGQYGAPQQPLQAERPMTVDDVVTNTGITLGVIIALAAVNFGIAAFVNVQLALFLTLIGAIGGLITVLVGTFGKKYGSKAITLTYAAFEGLFVGGISVVLSGFIVACSSGRPSSAPWAYSSACCTCTRPVPSRSPPGLTAS